MQELLITSTFDIPGKVLGVVTKWKHTVEITSSTKCSNHLA